MSRVQREADSSVSSPGDALTQNGTGKPLLQQNLSTDKEEIEKRLRESEERYRSLVSATAQIVWTTRVDGRTGGDLTAWCAYTGLSKEQAQGEAILAPIHPDDRERARKAWSKAIATHSIYETEYRLRRFDGVYRTFIVRGVPVLNTDGAIREWIGTCTDVTEQRQLQEQLLVLEQTARTNAERVDVTERRNLERRTHEALDGLLEMAEALVRLSDTREDVRTIGQRIAELTCRVLDCQRVGVQVVEGDAQMVRPLAVVGLSPEQEREWWLEQEQQAQSLLDNPMPELVERLRANEVLVLDLTQPPFNAAPNPYNIKTMLIAPMYVSDRLVGLLTLDYNGTDHLYTASETALVSAVAKLAAMVLERQRLLLEQAASAARELALREANSRMEEFLGIASHELRTPLTTIKANVQLAQRRLKGVAQQADQLPSEVTTKVSIAQDMLMRAERQVGVLNRLVGDLIDISRIQTGKLQLHLRKEPCDLAQVVRETVQEQRKATPERTIILQIAARQPVPVIADPDRIAQVLTNYLGNALKYSESDKSVDVLLEIQISPEKVPEARISVRDQGPGLSLQEQKRIWECFYQAEDVKVLSGSGVGLGLGLYISQTIIQRHHGQVGVESRIPGGSTFWFALPLAQEYNEQ